MDNVARKYDEAGIPKVNQQRLVSGGVPWRGNQSDATVAKYIGITVDELKVLRRSQELSRQRHQLIDVVVELGSNPTLPMWSPCVCDIATRPMSSGFSPISAS